MQKEKASKKHKKYNTYDLSGEYGVGYTFKGEEFYFDLEDYNLIKDYCWYIDSNGYVQARYNNKKHILFHQILFPEATMIDHITHKTNDNRKFNLRIVTNSQNNINRGIMKNNTSGYTGVYYQKKENKWYASIRINGEYKYLGIFSNIEDAVKARKKAEEKYFGEYSYDNSMKVGEEYENLSYIS